MGACVSDQRLADFEKLVNGPQENATTSQQSEFQFEQFNKKKPIQINEELEYHHEYEKEDDAHDDHLNRPSTRNQWRDTEKRPKEDMEVHFRKQQRVEKEQKTRKVL